MVTILLNNTDKTNPISEEWEQKAIIDTAKLWKSNSDNSFVIKMLPDLKIEPAKLQLDMNYLVGRSITDELKLEGE